MTKHRNAVQMFSLCEIYSKTRLETSEFLKKTKFTTMDGGVSHINTEMFAFLSCLLKI